MVKGENSFDIMVKYIKYNFVHLKIRFKTVLNLTGMLQGQKKKLLNQNYNFSLIYINFIY
jgi:hypothetical protein